MREYLSELSVKVKHLAFTLAEIATAVTVGGIVSILVLNTAVKEITTQTMNTQRVLANNEIAVAVADLQAEDALAGNKTQEEFNEKFKKVLAFEEIKEDEISDKFALQYTDSNGKTFSPNDYKNKVVTSGGVSFAYTYDTTCSTNYQFSQGSSAKVGNNYASAIKNEALKCIKGFFDINGAKGPNEYGKDVMPLTPFNKDCYDKNGNLTNFIPNAYGNCPDDKNKNKEDTLTPAQNVCALTELNCKANGSLKTLDRSSCECVCRISCPKGSTLNKDTCTCSCDTNKILTTICKRSDKTLNPYADCEASQQACTCMPKNPNAEKICRDNGGEWNSVTCSCGCPDDVKNKIKKEYYNLAVADGNNYCIPKCLYSSKSEQFKAQIKKNAQDAGLDDAKVIEITNVSSVEDKCFACAPNSASNMEYTKNDKGEDGGFCSNGCSDSVKKSTAYDTNYFKFNDYNKNDLANSCKWTCKTGDNEGIKKLVKELNAKPSYTSAKILNEVDKSNNLENFKLAQYHFFEAAAIGKGRSQYEGYYGDGINQVVVINGKPYTAQVVYNCEDRGCGKVYRAFKNNDSVFAGFLKYADSPETAPDYAFGWKPGTGKDTYKIHYTANTNNCTVETKGFDFGEAPTNQIPYHSAGVDRRKWEMVTFGFEPIKNTNLEIKNPNNNIKAPEIFKSQGGYSQYSDEYWKNIPIGVSISYMTQYDPLALNIGSSPNADPTVDSVVSVSFPIEYVSKNNYKNVSVHWPNENSYRFIVNEDFKNNTHIGNMFSDQMSSDGTRYTTGFDQLQAQYDGKITGTIKDGIIDQDEMKTLYLYRHKNANDKSWNTMDHSFVPLTDFVLDINLYKDDVRDESGSGIQDDNIIYDIQGSYRRLANVSYSKPACPGGYFCMSYIGYKRDNLDNELKIYLKNEEGTKYIAELWQDMKNNNIYYYYLREKGGVLKDYPRNKDDWQKIVKTDVVETTGATLPNKAIKVENNIPDAILEKITNEQGTTITVYIDEDGAYYIVKETVIKEPEDNQPEEDNDDNTSVAPSSTNSNTVNKPNWGIAPRVIPKNNQTNQETKKEVTKYQLNKYSKGVITENGFKMYFKKDSKWFEVIIAKVTDIIFKYSR